jgi:hypothetical protein
MSERAAWRRVAEALAERLVSHAFCTDHSEANPEPDCPWCDDREAYRAYVDAGGRDFRPPPYTGRVVTLSEVAPNWPDRGGEKAT